MFKPDRYILKKYDPQKAGSASVPNRPGPWILAACLLILWVLPCAGQTIQDRKGRRIEFSRPFDRIISLYGAHTENLFSLGLDREIIGVSVNDTRLPKGTDRQRFSYHDDPEKFLGAMPNLVLVRPMIDKGYPGFTKQLERYGITVVSLQPATVHEMFAYWMTLGQLTGKAQEARELALSFQKQTDRITQLVRSKIRHKKRVYFQAIHSRMKTFTPGSMAIWALETAGGINAAPDAKASRNTNIAVYGKEQILAKASGIDLFLAQKGIMNPVSVEMIRNEPGFEIIKAVKEKQIFLIDENIVSRPVPRLIRGVMTIGQLLYPDVFKDLDLKKDDL